ncbi:MAG: glycosyltransferase [Actinomycetota bacterium]|nr:glycosyltransferase [Actinomycetota bacterium]
MNEITRTDMHVHSSASALSKLGVQRSLGIPECATEPAEVYELAKRRGMDFVTLTDHDTIAGALELAHLSDTLISEELTAWFKGQPQAVHVLCYGITPDDHDWLQAHNHDLEACARYLHEAEITAALAHPFYAVGAPLTARHRRRLAELFPIWETRNGARAKELNLPAFIYIETHGGIGISGSDDHAGIEVGRTFTQTPPATSVPEFLAHVRAGRVETRGTQGSPAKWAHAAIALAIRTSGRRSGEQAPDPAAVLRIVERVLSEGAARSSGSGGDLGPRDAQALLEAWTRAIEPEIEYASVLDVLVEGRLDHADLERRARRVHERKLAQSARTIVSALERTAVAPAATSVQELQHAALELFAAAVPAVPYVAAEAFLASEKRRLERGGSDRPRVALVADGLGAVHGASSAIRQVRERGVPGFEVEIVGTDADVDRRLSAVTELEIPFYPGLRVGVPSLPAIVEAITQGGYDLLHVCSPGPSGCAAWMIARALGIPIAGSYHTELAAYAGLRSGRAEVGRFAGVALSMFYGGCDAVLSPSPSSDEQLTALGIPPERLARWDRGVDLRRFTPKLSKPGLLPGQVNVLYAGRLAREKGIELLAEAFLQAHRQDPRLHLVLAGGGPDEQLLRDRLGENATFLGWLSGEELARVYASADMFLFASKTDTFGQVILEAQASGLPVIAVDRGGPAALIEHGDSGLLVPPDAYRLGDALISLVRDELLRERLRRGGVSATRERSWGATLGRLADGYRLALRQVTGNPARGAATGALAPSANT